MGIELTEVIVHQGNPTQDKGFHQAKEPRTDPELGSQDSGHSQRLTPWPILQLPSLFSRPLYTALPKPSSQNNVFITSLPRSRIYHGFLGPQDSDPSLILPFPVVPLS